MTDLAQDTQPPVFGPDGRMMGNLTSDQGQPPATFNERFGQQMEGVQKADEAALAQRSAGMLKPMSALSRITSTPVPQAPDQQKLGPAPDAKDYQQNSMAFASAMAVLGAVASKFTRVSGTASLSAFAGALKGWQTGNLQAYENAAKKWEEDTKATIENNRQIMDKYRLALENRKMNIDEQMSQIQLISAQYHDQIMYDAAAAKNYTLVAQIYEKNHEFTEKAALAAAKLQESRDKDRQKNEQSGAYWLSPEGQARFQTLQPSQQAAVKQIIDIYAQKQVGKSAIAQDRQQFINEYMDAHGGQKPTSAQITDWEGQRAGATAYGRTAGTQGARVESATNEVEQLIPQAVEASRNYTRQGGNYVGLNKLFQAYDQGKSDPKYNDFVLANFSLINAYTRAMNPQGVPRIAERMEQHAMGILSTATSEQAYEVQVRRLWKEVQASKTAIAKTSEGRNPGDINAPVPGMDAPAVGGGGDSSIPPGWDVKVH